MATTRKTRIARHRRGEIVTIFTDPVTHEDVEGRAKLLRFKVRDDLEGMERWVVQFLGDDLHCVERWIKD